MGVNIYVVDDRTKVKVEWWDQFRYMGDTAIANSEEIEWAYAERGLARLKKRPKDWDLFKRVVERLVPPSGLPRWYQAIDKMRTDEHLWFIFVR